jgi:CDP-glucose 4,6-dehydratase
VIASSDKAYGEHATLPYVEDMPLQGRHPYEVSKSCTDLIAQSYSHTYGLPIAIARCGNIYGGADLNWSRIVPDTIRALLSGQRPIIRSDGSYIRDYIYVKDVSRAYMRLAEYVDKPEVRGEAFNFSPERAVTVLELVAIIRRLMGCEDIEPDIRNTARGEIHSQFLSSEKAHRLLRWQPQYTFDEGLRETIAWYEQYLAAFAIHRINKEGNHD